MPAVAKRTRSLSRAERASKRRRTTKQVTFHDDEGDTITFRINANGHLVELCNGKQTLAPVTIMSINESTGRVEDDDGPNDGFNLKELDRIHELRDLAQAAKGLTLDWIPRPETEEPAKPTTVVPPLAFGPDIEAWKRKWSRRGSMESETAESEGTAKAEEEPFKPIEEPQKPAAAEEPKEASPVKKSPAKKPAAKKPRKTRSKSRSRSRSKSRTPRKPKTPRAPKVWEPISFIDEEGDKVSFVITKDGFLQEKVNDKVTLAKVGRLDINTALSRIVDDDGIYDAFKVKETEKLGKLRDMCLHAMDLKLSWSTEAPAPEAWCSVM